MATTNMNIASKIWNGQNKHEHSKQTQNGHNKHEHNKQIWNGQHKHEHDKKNTHFDLRNFKCWASTDESSR